MTPQEQRVKSSKWVYQVKNDQDKNFRKRGKDLSTIVCHHYENRHYAPFHTETKKVTPFYDTLLHVSTCLMLVDFILQGLLILVQQNT